MRLLRSFPILAHAVLLLSIVGVGVATGIYALLLVCGVLAAMSWYVTEGPRGRSLPNWTANVLIVAAVLSVVVDLAQNRFDVMVVLARFIVWLTLIKLYQHKSPRDYSQLLGLSLLLMLIGALLSTGLLFAGVLLIYAILGLYVLLLFQLYAAHERTRAARLEAIPAGYRLVPSLQPIVGRRTALHLRSLMATVAVGGLAASAVLFVMFPREWGADFMTGGPGPGAARSGFAGDVDLIAGTRITDSHRIVLNLSLPDGRAGLELPLLLRGAVLDRYETGGRWVASESSSRSSITIESGLLTDLGASAHNRMLTQRVEVVVAQPALFSVYVPVAVGTDPERELEFDRITQTLEAVDRRQVLRYTIKADPSPDDATLRALANGADPIDVEPIMAPFRKFDPRVIDLAHEILDMRSIPRDPPGGDERWTWRAAAAGALEAYLQNSGLSNLEYTTDLSGVEFRSPDEHGDKSRDPIVQFLFEARQGHCEYFASALAALCNCMGIPARLVTGFVAIETSERADEFVVRERHAHAWVEVQVSPWRWDAFDPTPAGELKRLGDGTMDSLADRWRWLFDNFEAGWANGFVAFNRDSQNRLMQRIDLGWSQKFGNALDATRQWLAAVNRAFYFGPAGYIWMGIVALAVVIAAIAIGMRMRRAARLRATMHLAHLRGGVYHRMLWQLGFYLDMLEALEQSGLGKPAWQPPLQFAHALSDRHPEGARLVRRLTRLFYAARFGERRLSRDELSHAEELLSQLTQALRRPGP
ncbi:MAG: DUF3488 and transglutaminase-like domain-containing protein [Planctomycetota bacterium]|jgi:transglutaminase-like putative cysteine protease